VVFGATVDLEDEDSGAKVTYQIVGDDEADLKLGLISISSPIARALIGKEAGDVAEVQAPRRRQALGDRRRALRRRPTPAWGFAMCCSCSSASPAARAAEAAGQGSVQYLQAWLLMAGALFCTVPATSGAADDGSCARRGRVRFGLSEQLHASVPRLLRLKGLLLLALLWRLRPMSAMSRRAVRRPGAFLDACRLVRLRARLIRPPAVSARCPAP
jgi:hypothetical protein